VRVQRGQQHHEPGGLQGARIGLVTLATGLAVQPCLLALGRVRWLARDDQPRRHTGAGRADPHSMLHHRLAAGRQGGEKIEGLTGIIEQSDRAPADPGDEICPACSGVDEVAHPGITAILHHHVARPHGDAA